jgi:hypothetical protein
MSDKKLVKLSDLVALQAMFREQAEKGCAEATKGGIR